MPNTAIEQFTCDRCGFDYTKSKLRKQRGMYLCSTCFDVLSKISTRRPRFNPSRENSTSTGVPADTVPRVLTVSSVTGVDRLFQSNQLATRRDGVHQSIYMNVVSDGGAITISANPQIVAGKDGDILTLRGTSNVDTIQLDDSPTLFLNGGGSIILKYGDTINLVYNTFDDSIGGIIGGWGNSEWGSTGYGFGGATEGWVEASRYKGGI